MFGLAVAILMKDKEEIATYLMCHLMGIGIIMLLIMAVTLFVLGFVGIADPNMFREL